MSTRSSLSCQTQQALLPLWTLLILNLVLMLFSGPLLAAPYVPDNDATVLESLPYRLFGSKSRSNAMVSQAMRPSVLTPQSQAAAPPADPNAAVQLARQYLEQARERGDPRFAGYALAALRPWRDEPHAPAPVILMQATLDQYQHDFARARQRLTDLLKTAPTNVPVTGQAWLTLATIDRVQGRYAESDRACNSVAHLSTLYALACLTENAGLRAQTDAQINAAARQLAELLATPVLQNPEQKDTRRWLLTTLAELQERAGHSAVADQAYRKALTLMDRDAQDSYLVFAYADFLLAQSRPKEVLKLLATQPEPISDGALLRRAMAARMTGLKEADQDAAQLSERFAAQLERGDGATKHGRELARFELYVQGDAAQAVAYARENLRIQKEPIDLLIMTEAALAAKDPAALQELKTQMAQQGLADARINRLLQRTVS